MHARTYWTHRDRVPWAIERNINPFARLSRMENSRKRSRRRDRPRNRRRPGQEGIRRLLFKGGKVSKEEGVGNP